MIFNENHLFYESLLQNKLFIKYCVDHSPNIIKQYLINCLIGIPWPLQVVGTCYLNEKLN